MTKPQERTLANRVKWLAERGFPITMDRLRTSAYQFCEKEGICHRFNVNTKMAGQDWAVAFCKRNSISTRQSQGLSMARKSGLTRKAVGKYFTALEKELNDLQIRNKPHQIFNADETGLQMINPPQKVLTEKGARQVYSVTTGERGETFTVLGCMSASGSYIPPYIVFKGVRKRPEWSEGFPPGTRIEVSDTGYMKDELFVSFLEHFRAHTPPGPTVLIVDGHQTHVSLRALEYGIANDISLVALPPHTTHLLQPADRSFFKPLKSYWKTATNRHVRNTGMKITKFNVGKLVSEAWGKAAQVGTAVNGFAVCGINPFNSGVIPDHLYDDSDDEDNPSTSCESVPSVSGEPNPSTSGEPNPSTSGEPEPSTSSEPNPSPSAEPEPSMSGDPAPSLSGEPEPSTSGEPEPSGGPLLSESGETQPSILDEPEPFRSRVSLNEPPSSGSGANSENRQACGEEPSTSAGTSVQAPTDPNSPPSEAECPTTPANVTSGAAVPEGQRLSTPVRTQQQFRDLLPTPVKDKRPVRCRTSLFGKLTTPENVANARKKAEAKASKNKGKRSASMAQRKIDSQTTKKNNPKKVRATESKVQKQTKKKTTVRKAKSVKQFSKSSDKVSDEDDVMCVCGKTFQDDAACRNGAKWVQCMMCKKWFHAHCQVNGYDRKFECDDCYFDD